MARAMTPVALSRVRGLKPAYAECPWKEFRRTLTSAWIETRRRLPGRRNRSVALSRVRGLKPRLSWGTTAPSTVALSRVRGLKLIVSPIFNAPFCRTLTSAWIETIKIVLRYRS